MALDEDDVKQVVKIVNDSVKALGGKLEGKLGEVVSKAIEEGVGTKLEAERKRSQAEAEEAAKKGKGAEDSEKKTQRERIEALEAQAKKDHEEKEALRAQAKVEREAAKFSEAWTGKKLVPDLAKPHLAMLREEKRLIHEEDGTVRVRDPKKDKYDVMPTLDEYVSALASGDSGRVYQPASSAHGGGARPGQVQQLPTGRIENAMGMLITGEK